VRPSLPIGSSSHRDGNPIVCVSFVTLTFCLTWAIILLVPTGRVMAGFAPMVIALFLQKIVYNGPLAGPLGVSLKPNRWFLISWFSPFAIAFACLGASLLFPGVEYAANLGRAADWVSAGHPEILNQDTAEAAKSITYDPSALLWWALVSGIIKGSTLYIVFAFGEELGWRGFMQKELSSMGFWRSSVLIGIIWGLWHAPSILVEKLNFPQDPVAGVFMMIISCLLMAPVFAYVRLRAKSVLATTLFHGSLNGASLLAIVLLGTGNDFDTGLVGAPGAIVFALVTVCLLIYDRFFASEPIMCKPSSSHAGERKQSRHGRSTERSRER
jgi:membrane protease YdiL (CAAX protease family)